MRVFDKDKNHEIKDWDLNKGRLLQDTLTTTIEAVDGQDEVGHYEVVATYPNGGEDIKWVVDKPFVKAQPQRQEVEEIMVFVPFSPQEQKQYDQTRYEMLVESKIRAKYNLSQELAILRQRDSKIDEYKEYFEFCEECKRQAREEMGFQG